MSRVFVQKVYNEGTLMRNWKKRWKIKIKLRDQDNEQHDENIKINMN